MAISGARDKAYTPVAGDVGRRLKVRVTADGGPTAESPASNPVGPPDSAPPSVEVPVSTFDGVIGSGGSVTSTPVQTSWSASDEGSGICAYGLEVSRDGGAYAKVKLASATATSVTQDLAAGTRAVYRVTATDCSGNAATRTGVVVAPDLRDVAAGPGMAFTGSWGTQSYAYAFGGSLRYSTVAGAKITYTTSTRLLAFAARRAPDRGAVRISVDGGEPELVDLFAPSADTRAIVYQHAFPTLAQHTITVENAGTPGRPRVEPDAFASLGS